MSLVNVWVSNQRAVVCTDTLATDIEGNFFAASKMVALVHANLLLAVQGSQDLLAGVYVGLQFGKKDIDFDHLEESLPGMLEGSVAAMTAHCQENGISSDSEALKPSKFFVVGWSNTRQSMAALCFEPSFQSGPTTRKTEARAWFCAPGNIPALRGFDFQPTDQSMRAIAEAQVRHFVPEPSVAIGGSLLLAEITRHTLNIRSLGSL